MAASKSAVIDLVSSDDEDSSSPRPRQRGLLGRKSRSLSRNMTPESPPTLQASTAPTAAPTAAWMGVTPPAPAFSLDGDAAGGADLFNAGNADIFDVDDMMNFNYFFEMPGGYPPEDQMAPAAPREPSPPRAGQVIVIDGEDVFIPDSPPPDRAEPVWAHRQEILDQDAVYAQETENFTADVCLKRVRAMFPDIDHEHVFNLYNDYDARGTEALPGSARLEAIVEKLLSGEVYPRQAKLAPQRKRKREDEATNRESKRWEGPDREVAGPAFRGAISSILKVEFPEITKAVIMKVLLENDHLFQTYLALAKMKDAGDANRRWSGRPPKDITTADSLASHCGWPSISDELEAARQHVKYLRQQRAIDDAKLWAEKENLQRAIDANETAECQACFDDLPMNRQIHCDGDTAHFTCYDCATAYVKSEVGDSRCKVLCTAGCGASFARAQLHLLEDKDLLEKLEQLQQEKEIREADLDNLEECPFCDYKAILPPIEEDFEFRCANIQCEKVSCRRCKAVSHIPMSCAEHAKEHKLSSRHKIEEAMTKALIRNCAKCNKGFIKEYGCNKMSCPSCGNLQCYVCSESLKDYNHFDQTPRGLLGAKSSKCPLYDNVEERHEREIKEAEAAARAEVISENPDVSEQDLEITVSDGVKKATDERVKRAGAIPGGIPPGHGGVVGAGFPLGGLYIPPGVGRRFRDRANNMEAQLREHEEEQDGLGDLVRLRRRRLEIGRLLEQYDADDNINGPREMPPNIAVRDVAARPGLQAFAGVIPRALVRRPNPRPPPVLQPLPGGFNEDPFGGDDDGDRLALNRLMYPPLRLPPGPVPALPVRGPPINPAARNNERIRELQQRLEMLRNQNIEFARPHERQQPHQVPVVLPQHLQRQPLVEFERLRQLEARTLEARRRFDDLRGGHGQFFRRDTLDPQGQPGPRGWPEQN